MSSKYIISDNGMIERDLVLSILSPDTGVVYRLVFSEGNKYQPNPIPPECELFVINSQYVPMDDIHVVAPAYTGHEAIQVFRDLSVLADEDPEEIEDLIMEALDVLVRRWQGEVETEAIADEADSISY